VPVSLLIFIVRAFLCVVYIIPFTAISHHKPLIKSVYTVTNNENNCLKVFVVTYVYTLQSRSVSADHRCMLQDCRQRCSVTAKAMGVNSRDQSSASSNRMSTNKRKRNTMQATILNSHHTRNKWNHGSRLKQPNAKPSNVWQIGK
jgi:hypothetical protein